MPKRDYVAEILSRRNRIRRRAPRYDEVSARMSGIIDIADFVRHSRDRQVPFRAELAKYVPIGMVACIEGYFRLVIRDLIDAGSPFRENVAKFSEIKISVDHALALQTKKITFGEFVAHLLPVHNLDDLNQSMSTLIGESFIDRLKRTKTDYFGSGDISLEEDGITGAVMRDAKMLFEQRHIFVHELATKTKVSPRKLAVDSAAGTILMWGTEALMVELLAQAT